MSDLVDMLIARATGNAPLDDADRRMMRNAAEQLRDIDERLARRPALAKCETRGEKVELLCAKAAHFEDTLASIAHEALNKPVHQTPPVDGEVNLSEK